jgi:hypothetical protein
MKRRVKEVKKGKERKGREGTGETRDSTERGGDGKKEEE